MSRYKTYQSDEALRKAVTAYFNSISRIRGVMEEYRTGEKDERGHFVKEWRAVTNEKGKPIEEREYVIPPTVGGLCAHLKISRQTWAVYCNSTENPQFAETTEWAREQMFAWREKELLRRPVKQLRGLIFDLRANYGMSENPTAGPMAPDAQEDDPITKSLKEAADVLRETDTGAPMALSGEAGADL